MDIAIRLLFSSFHHVFQSEYFTHFLYRTKVICGIHIHAAYDSLLLDIGLSQFKSSTLTHTLRPPPNASSQNQQTFPCPSGWVSSYTTFASRSLVLYSFASTAIGSSTNMVSPLTLQIVYSTNHVSSFFFDGQSHS